MRVNRKRGTIVLLAAATLLVMSSAGCGRRGTDTRPLAQVGEHKLTGQTLSALAGIPADSLSGPQCWQLVNTWVERTLVEMEGERRGFANDDEMAARLSVLRAELYRSRLLSENPAAAPTDSAIASYYAAHRAEFLRPVDAYLIELYWSEQEPAMTQFRSALATGDTSMLAGGEVVAEGRWLAESGELPPELERELASLKTGEVTFPRPYEDGYRIARLLEMFPAGRVLDLSVVRDEIAARQAVEQSRRRQDSLIAALRERYPVRIFLKDSL